MDLATLEAQISTAIGQQETQSGITGTGASLNNPGGLKYADWEAKYGATGTAGSFAKFPSLADGITAMKDRISQLISGGASVTSLVNTWAPAGDNNTNNAARIAAIAKTTGLDPNQSIAQQAKQTAAATEQDTNPELPGYVAPDQYEIAHNPALANKAGAGWDTTWGRVAAFAVGIICLIMGIALMKQSQVIIEHLGKAAELAAAV